MVSSPTNDAAAPPPGAPTSNVTINLINRLVQKGILSQAEAAEMIQQAQADAVQKNVGGNDGEAQ